jgi:RNA polymerase sigma-70 factor (family 1)
LYETISYSYLTDMADYSTYTDQELLGLLTKDDDSAFSEAAFSELYNRNWQFLYNSVYGILRKHEDAMDVCQALFVWLWENRSRLVIRTNFKAYLFVAAKYKVANLIREGKVRNTLFENVDFERIPDESFNQLEVKELENLINQLINELPPKCREIFLLSREQGLTHKQIARQLNISEKTVDEQISRALRKLRGPLGKLASLLIIS